LAFRRGQGFPDRLARCNFLIQLCSHSGDGLCCLFTAELGSFPRLAFLCKIRVRRFKGRLSSDEGRLGSIAGLCFLHQLLARRTLRSLCNRLGGCREFPRFNFARKPFVQNFCLVLRRFESDAGGEIGPEKALIFSGGPPKRGAKAECQRSHRGERIDEIRVTRHSLFLTILLTAVIDGCFNSL
jgi:hypothetical protein